MRAYMMKGYLLLSYSVLHLYTVTTFNLVVKVVVRFCICFMLPRIEIFTTISYILGYILTSVQNERFENLNKTSKTTIPPYSDFK